MAIGGAVDDEESILFQEFLKRAGGAKARIVVLPQASSMKNTGRGYCGVFKKLGARSMPVSLEFRERKEADKKKHLEALRAATGIFITGGTQIRITSIIRGTDFEQELLAAYRRGAVICGTSAGTAVMSKVMLAYGKSGVTPREGIARFSPGLGFTDKIIFDQHVRQRDRLGRLAYAISMHPGMLGVGVDENEARAQWWPRLFLSALVGRQDLRLNALDLAPVHFSNVALALAAPIFNAGRIDAGIHAQSARADEALLAWQKSVLVAVQEVENSLLVRSQEADRHAALALTVEHRRSSLRRAESLQREGQIDLLVLLDVQRSVLASELALSDSRLQQALADVQLFKALGGGFSLAQADADRTPIAARTPQ